MKTLLKLSVKHGRNLLSETLYLRMGRDMTRPVFFYALSTDRCNARCISCESWKNPRENELSIEEWQSALLSIKDFVGEYSISFSGGEPLIKNGFIDLLEFCHNNGIHAGFTTNGSRITKSIAERVAAIDPFNVNISVDGPNAEIHDYLRGRPGFYDKVTQGITYLIEERTARKAHFPIVIKPTINAVNFRYMPAMVEWVKEIGATAVNFQPVDDWHWSEETREILWVKPEDLDELSRTMDELIEMKRNGAPILTSETTLNLVTPHFRGEKAPAETLPCRVGLSYMYIEPDGDIRICPQFQPIGNLRDQSAEEIWYGTKGSEVRKETINCQRLCLLTCVSNKSIKDRVKVGMKLFNPLAKRN